MKKPTYEDVLFNTLQKYGTLPKQLLEDFLRAQCLENGIRVKPLEKLTQLVKFQDGLVSLHGERRPTPAAMIDAFRILVDHHPTLFMHLPGAAPLYITFNKDDQNYFVYVPSTNPHRIRAVLPDKVFLQPFNHAIIAVRQEEELQPVLEENLPFPLIFAKMGERIKYVQYTPQPD